MVCGRTTLTASQVVKYLRDFIDETGGEWDWDDFTSIPIGNDARLEEIRSEADMISLPVNEAGLAKLHELLARGTALPKIQTEMLPLPAEQVGNFC
jgi:hypothetical protein